ncbi:unnamed protein product [Paramecium octaurelia]|uniref:Uncharacterized protein n=1 Tax=Paramecium octaurelia TaxID=43137 RepID=A0A8S1YDW0_PAROT|nr:unnamed protein product [Paramecium octaurelia]
MFQDKYGKTVSEFNQKYNIVTNPSQLRFDEGLLNYKYNSLLGQFQDSLLQDIRAAIVTAQRGYLSRKVLKHYFKELPQQLRAEYFGSLLTLYKESLRQQQQNLFYFSGMGSGMKVEKVTWPFVEGFGFCIWIQVENINYELFNEQNMGVQKIISVHGQGQQGGGGLECFILRGSVYYRIIPAIYQEPDNGAILIGQLKNGMNFIGISHECQKKFTSSHLTLYFNNEQPKSMTLDFPRLNQTIALTRFTICENLLGTAQCIIIMNQSSTKIKTIQSVYGQLPMDFKQLKTLPACLDKYFERIMSIYIPEFTDGNHVIDVMGNCNATLLNKSGAVMADKNKFHFSGGFRLFYVMLHLSGTLYKQINSAQLNLSTMFEVITHILKNNNQLQAEAFNSQFFLTLASIIMSFEKPLINTKCVELLSEIKSMIGDNRLLDHFFIHILWNPKLHQKCISEQVFSKYLQLACQVYLQNPQHYQHFISSKDILDMLIFAYTENQCCDQHFNDFEESFQMQFLEKIFYLFNQQPDVSEHLVLFDQYLMSKISPCILLQILTILKSLLVDNEDQGIKTNFILQSWDQNNIVDSLLFIFKSTPHYDIRAMIVYFLHLIFQQQFPNHKLQTHQAIEYITNAIEPLIELNRCSQVQPIKKEQPQQQQQQGDFDELKNLGTQFLNNDYESVPQAPSMTNRRKPPQGFFDNNQRPPPRAQSIPAPETEKSNPPSFSVDQKGKKKFHIKIDTDAINALYNFGGEQGKKNGFDHEAFNKELAEINRLAKACHMYMQGHREPEEPYVESPKQQESPLQNQNTESPKQQQTVVRQPPMSTKNSQAPKQQFQQELTQIKEVSSSSMSIQQIEQVQKKKIESFASIYNQLMGWMIDKIKIGVNESLMIEERDQIKNEGIINAIMKIVAFSLDENLTAQILQDLLCLCKSHQGNSILILGQATFQSELLRVLSTQEDNTLIYEIGSRLHSTLIVQVLKSEFIGANYIYELLKWGIDHNQKLVEMQMNVIIDLLHEQCKAFQTDSQLWKNIIQMALYIVELKQHYSQLISKLNNFYDLIHKDYLVNGNTEEQIASISKCFNHPDSAQKAQSFFNSRIQNHQVYEIILESSNQTNIHQFLITYAITQEICQFEMSYGLTHIISKLRNHEHFKDSIMILCFIIFVSKEKNQPSQLRKYLMELYSDFETLFESLQANSFHDDSILDQLISFLIQCNALKQETQIKANIPQQWSIESIVSPQKVTRDVQQIGENKYIEIEERKVQWVYKESERERIGRNKYHKSLNSLFLNDGWLSQCQGCIQRNDLIQDITQEQFVQSKYFKIKISKMLTKSFARPYIKSIPIIPDVLRNKPVYQTPQTAPLLLGHEMDKFEQLYGQRQSTNSQAVQAATQLLNMGKAFGNNIRNAVKTIANQKVQAVENIRSFGENTFRGKKVIVINGLYIYYALMSLTNTHILLQYEHLKSEGSHAALGVFELKEDQRLLKKYPIYNLVLVIKKKYLQKRTALEIFFIDGKSLFINICDQNDLDEISAKLLKHRKTHLAPYLNQSKTTDPVKLLEKQGYLQKWNKQQMSNFKYLLLLNNLASRSYNDFTQYPVFPWVICEPKDQQLVQEASAKIYPEGQFRAMQKTMGALGNNSRIKSYIERFEQSEQGGEIPAFHYGSHYSSLAITSQFLIRLEPFTTIAREIQGNKFDIPDRLFYSFVESFRCATEDIADVRELIPEMFCLPEMFINLQNLQFGKTQSGIMVNNVQLPKWSHNNPWRFVAGQRNALESEDIQRTIPEWIDLIFGFKQRGKEAEKNLNIYFYVTYDQQLTLQMMEENRLSIEAQVVNFGITPLQLFLKPHIGRQINNEHHFVSNSQELKVYRPQNKKKVPNTMKPIIDLQQASNRAIVKIKWISDVRLICIRKEGKIDYLKWTSQTDVQANQPPFQCGLEREKQFNFEKPQTELFNIWDVSAQLSSYPMLVFNQGKLFICGGYHLGKLIIIGDNNQIIDIYQLHTATITTLASDKKESMIISGDKSGHVILWNVDKQKDIYKLHAKCMYFDHQNQINCIYVSTSMKLFATGCTGGYIYLYNLFNGQLMRSFIHPNKNPINSIVMSNRPLFCIVFYSAFDHQIYCYSINGFLLEVQSEQSSSLIDCQIMRNNLFQDIMVYGTENGELVRRSLPYLQQLKRFQISAKSPVLSITCSKDKRFFICGCNDGEISVMAEPQQNK